MQDAAELLRACATDAEAVQLYLRSIDPEELDGLLDEFSRYENQKKKSHSATSDTPNWPPLVRLLLRSPTSRLRTATRIIQLLWHGGSSELASMQWLTEISLGYVGVLEDKHHGNSSRSSSSKAQQQQKQRSTLVHELKVILEIVFEFLRNVIAEQRHGKVLPQLLSLVPLFLSILTELQAVGGSSDNVVHENLVTLLELPWDVKTIPFLLDLLKESGGLLSPSGWKQLRENVARMVASNQSAMTANMNTILRECILIANVTNDVEWILISRLIFSHLPMNLRQEAEFTLHMCFHQSQRVVALICESVRKSLGDDQIRRYEGESPIMEDTMNIRVGWHDLVLLFHALQASKPVLHHRATSSRVATDASVFVEIQHMAWTIFQLDFQDHLESAAHSKTNSPLNWPKYITEKVSQIIAFGGKQVHAREWKALLLMDFAFFWMEQDERATKQSVSKTKKHSRKHSSVSDSQLGLPATRDLARYILLAVYQTTPEVRSELLSSLFDGSKNTQYTTIYSAAIEQMFRTYSGSLHSHLNPVQDWLSSLFHNHFEIAQEYFLMTSRLATMYKDLYSFLMIFLRKLLSMAKRRYQQFAIDVWCSWFEQGLTFDVQQEEEIVSAIKNSILVCPGILSWSLDRLTRVFLGHGKDQQGLNLRRSSWEDFHRFISHQLGQFIQYNAVAEPSRNANTSRESIESDFEEEDGDSSFECQRFCFHSLEAFYQQNSSFTGAAEIGVIFQKTFLCLVRFEQAAERSFASNDIQVPAFSTMGSAMSRWIIHFVSNLDFFFHWVCQQPDGNTFRESVSSSVSKSDLVAMWHMIARVTLGCGLSSLALELTLQNLNPELDEAAQRRKKLDENASPSLWRLIEIQFCLHRVLRKLINAATIDATASKMCYSASIRGLSSVLEPNTIQLLSIMNGTLTGQDQQMESNLGVSFDAVLFILDVCRSHVSVVATGRHPTHSKSELFGMFEVLLQLYRNLVHRALHAAEMNEDEAEIEDQTAIIFTSYSDAITAKFPKSLRHLAAGAKNMKAVVLLDVKAAELALSRVCAALTVAVDAMVVLNGVHETEDQLRLHLESSEPHIGRNGLVARQARSNGFFDLAHEILFDVKQSMSTNELTKFKISGANLSKRLSEHGARIASISTQALADGLSILSSLAYDAVCEHAVYQPPLFRGLLSICFSNHLLSDLDFFVWLADKIEATIQASGFQLVSIKRIQTANEEEKKRRRDVRQKSIRTEPSPLVRRKRLRQVIEISSDEEDEDTTTSACENHQASAATQPYLNSPAVQVAAILSVLSSAENAQATCFKVLSAGSIKRILEPLATMETYGRTMRVLLQTLLSDHDLSWVTPKLQAKMITVIEWNLRIGKACDTARKANAAASSPLNEVIVNLLECAIHVGLNSRSWTQLLRGGNQDTAMRARISAVSMKIDIFLLDAPQMILPMMKDKTLKESLHTRLKALLASIQEQFVTSAPQKGSKKAKAHLVGVVPIVKKRRKRLRSRHPYIDDCLGDEDGDDAYADLEDFIEA